MHQSLTMVAILLLVSCGVMVTSTQSTRGSTETDNSTHTLQTTMEDQPKEDKCKIPTIGSSRYYWYDNSPLELSAHLLSCRENITVRECIEGGF